ncbi:SDR family oxidoreductase [Lewinella sp. 4G2]|uniref:SDR family NAD(P)-dependent oxidoreductase n=1 Tax=Lewinella sp. 4G2 TaxID=1803372 RepID=UPI0007B4E7B2|nr:SDR family oxidoreductase [Lewinella sp. 4G2]OAV43547.1 hypothetical protein A3850_003125 [Lewinella sp. 4G2]
MSKTVLITGGTRGIGRACAEAFLAADYAVTIVARSSAALTEMATQLGVFTIAADLSKETGVAAVPIRPYDVVVLNAAAFAPGTLLDAESDTFTELLPLNVLANHHLARRLLPEMIAQNDGHLIVIGSTGTDNWKGHMTAYVANKYALRGLFYGWQQELALSQVRCTLVAPGATLTSSWDNEEVPEGILMPEEVAGVVLGVVEKGEEGRVCL